MSYRVPKTIGSKTVTAVIRGGRGGFHGNHSSAPVTAQVHPGGGWRRLQPLYNIHTVNEERESSKYSK